MIQEVAGLVGGRDGAAATLGPTDEAALTHAFVCAGGVSTAATEIGRSYASHGALAPRPARQRAAAAASTPRTDPVLVSQAVRELAGRAGAGLPDPWQAELHGAATSDLTSRAERLEAQLRAEVRRSRHQTRRAVGAVVVRTLAWLTIAAALAATAIILAGSTGHQTPLVGHTTARWVFAASVATVVLLLVGGRALVSWRGQIIAARVQQRLRAIARIHARECMGSLQAVLDDYRAARQSLWTAAGGSA